jgi:hypothetical protein
MKTRRGFLYTLVALPIATVVAKFVKPKEYKEMSPDDLLFFSRPQPQDRTFSWNEGKGRWDNE